MERKALGRGLEALLKPVAGASSSFEGMSVVKIAVDKIRPNRYQPRTRFTPDSLAELSESIKVHGLAQPLLVTASPVPGDYELVAGERRLRAARMAGLVDVPCVVRHLSERDRHELSLIENIQREDLNAIEEAESMRRLMDEVGMTQEEMSRRLGKSRSAVANRLRLLELPQMLRNALMEGLLTEGHARALLGLTDRAQQEDLGKRVVQEKMTVRDVEKIVANWATAARDGRLKPRRQKNADVRLLEEDLQRVLGRRVALDARDKTKGWLRLEFYSLDDLDALVKQLKSRAPSQ